MDPELLARLQGLMRPPVDVTATPARPAQPTIGPQTGTRVPPNQRGILAAIQRSAAASPDTPAGWANEMLNPVRAGAQAREFVGQVGQALRRGNVGAALGAGVLAAMSVPGIPSGGAAKATRAGVSAAEIVAQEAAMRNMLVGMEARPYFNVPDELMGYGRAPKGFSESNFPHTQTVLVRWPGQPPMVDQIRGMNPEHALERARRNWEGADIKPFYSPLPKDMSQWDPR